MSEPEGAPRRYTEKEVGRILKRATEIQIADPASPGAGGMTLDELEEIALEAGIDPRHLRRAALEVASGGGSGLGAKLAGQPLELRYEAVVPGELSAEGFERVLSAIHQAAREHGQSSLLGSTLTWQGESAQGRRSTQVLVTSRDGETQIVVEERFQDVAKQLFGGIVGGFGTGVGTGVGVGIGLGTLGSALFATLFPFGSIAIAYVVAREAFRFHVVGRQRSLTALLERVREEVLKATATAPLGPTQPPPALPRG